MRRFLYALAVCVAGLMVAHLVSAEPISTTVFIPLVMKPASAPKPPPPKPPPTPTPKPKPAPTATPQPNCDPSYPTVCIPPPPPDLDCPDIPHRNFIVRPPDPHRFDGDKDGIGCEE